MSQTTQEGENNLIEDYIKLKALQSGIANLEEWIESLEKNNPFNSPNILHYSKENLKKDKNEIVELELKIQEYKKSLNII